MPCGACCTFRVSFTAFGKYLSEVDNCLLHDIVEQLQRCINDCRANDTGRLKTACFKYINKSTTSIIPELSGENEGDKRLRGWAHPQMGRLLLPMEYEPTAE